MTNAVSHGHSRHAFEQSLPIVAAALGNKCGVRIEMGGRVPSTDGQTITLPFLELNQPELSSQEAQNKEREILGLLCHECGHVRFTNMKAGSNEVTSNFEHAVDNALEDVRIEKAMSAEYLGAEALFKAAHLPTVEELTKDMRLKGTQLIPLFLLAHAEQETLGRTWLSPLTAQLRKRMERSFGTELTEALAGLAVSVDRATCTEEVQAIRKQVMALLKQASQSPEQAANLTNPKLQNNRHSRPPQRLVTVRNQKTRKGWNRETDRRNLATPAIPTTLATVRREPETQGISCLNWTSGIDKKLRRSWKTKMPKSAIPWTCLRRLLKSGKGIRESMLFPESSWTLIATSARNKAAQEKDFVVWNKHVRIPSHFGTH